MFDILADLDTNCCVLEPGKPTFALTSRRLALERSCSVLVEARDPVSAPHSLCEMRFMGPPAKIAGKPKSKSIGLGLWLLLYTGAVYLVSCGVAH